MTNELNSGIEDDHLLRSYFIRHNDLNGCCEAETGISSNGKDVLCSSDDKGIVIMSIFCIFSPLLLCISFRNRICNG
jgi:hypothetical protein